uniref:4-alpha-glucanotransferase n=1 Tax=Pedobacter sp. TaxID=1411316 RepID=UPI003D7FC973
WDLSMVDPDNRRAVDYTLREQYLQEIMQDENNLSALWQQSENGKIKMLLLQRMLQLRKQYPLLFAEGLYIPLTVTGKHAARLLAFARHYKNDWLVVVVPVKVAIMTEGDPEQLQPQLWEDTRVVLPAHLPIQFKEQLTGIKGTANTALKVSEIFSVIPMAVLHFHQETPQRAAGILMPVFSLPSVYGIGDFGAEAKCFIDFLAAAGQRFWQVLPLNPVNASQAYSPYSSQSVMAGNILFLSPELLLQQGLLDEADLNGQQLKRSTAVNYKKVTAHKSQLLAKAYQQFKDKGQALGLQQKFAAFCEKEHYWLDDYALFEVLKKLHDNQPWYEWPAALKNRDKAAMDSLSIIQQNLIDEIKWQQFIVQQQWSQLKKYANTMNIKLIGDLPFYASRDSADVWANPGLFSLDEQGNVMGMAGVPPDYFNENGQLWGMPVYRWEAMAKADYQWWVARIRRNMDLYDLIRLDHFRAFAAYWEVPAGSEHAKTGGWKAGPGIAFFEALNKHFNDLPFLAEDLGEIDDAVFQLRDQLKLPGMKVLQFAVGNNAAASIHAPHQFSSPEAVVYTGTHDNNTIKGWYKNDISKADKKRLSAYVGHQVNKKNIHQVMISLAYASIAKIAVIPMQDILGKGEKARINTPASTDKNWLWRLNPHGLYFTAKLQQQLKFLVDLYGR